MSVTNDRPTSEDTDLSGEEKILAFCLGSEDYGLEILKVREIIGLIDITPLPRTPDYVKGVMNLRGRIIPVIDLRLKFGLPAAEPTKETCVIVVEGGTDDEHTTMGVVVDSVREVQDIPRSAIEEAPAFGCEIPLDYIQGMGKVKDRVVVLLDSARVLSTSEMRVITSATAAAETGDDSIRAAA
jgi:purine-binding chemotaxis protein CheW